MRISDWSSDVCSSDLSDDALSNLSIAIGLKLKGGRRSPSQRNISVPCRRGPVSITSTVGRLISWNLSLVTRSANISISRARSEEHTSELQSLMRISYAVLCLKKKNKKTSTRNKQ